MGLTVKIRQHTPMIHFQWDQSGATLRASELKPKLDKFLKEKNIPSLKDFFGEKGNLPYKLVVTASYKELSVDEIEKVKKDESGKIQLDKKGKPKKETFPSFFGNTGNSKEKKFVLYNNIQLKFISFVPEVIEELKNYLPEFFFVTNFGTRQSKGFGSFYLDPKDPLYKDPKEFKSYSFTLDNIRGSNPYEKYKDLFQCIDLFYRTLRSGINIKDRFGNTLFYFKPMMFLYAKSKNWTWDKKYIKSKFVPKDLEDQKIIHSNPDILTFSSSNEYLVRDLLGVAPSQAYKSYYFILQYDENNEIKRFKSPITFKPIFLGRKGGTEFTVYLILNPIHEGIFNKKFKINKVVEKEIGKTKEKVVVDTTELETPPSGEFNIEEFFEFALGINIDEHVDKEFQNDWRFKVIRKIYSQLNQNRGK
jgi:hypothetical protein